MPSSSPPTRGGAEAGALAIDYMRAGLRRVGRTGGARTDRGRTFDPPDQRAHEAGRSRPRHRRRCDGKSSVFQRNPLLRRRSGQQRPDHRRGRRRSRRGEEDRSEQSVRLRPQAVPPRTASSSTTRSTPKRSVSFKTRNAPASSPAPGAPVWENWMWRPNKKGVVALNPGIIAKSAAVIARDAGLTVPEDTRILLVEGAHPVEERPLRRRKTLSGPHHLQVFPLSKKRWRPSPALPTTPGPVTLAVSTRGNKSTSKPSVNGCARVVSWFACPKRPPTAVTSSTVCPAPSPSGAVPGVVIITTENIHWKHFINVTWVSEPIEGRAPTDDEMWGSFRKKYDI